MTREDGVTTDDRDTRVLVDHQPLELHAVDDLDTMEAQNLQNQDPFPTAADASAIVADAEALPLAVVEFNLRDRVNNLPGGALKTFAVRWLILSLPTSSFDMTYSLIKAGWTYQPMNTVGPLAGDMMLSSMTGAFILAVLAQLTGTADRIDSDEIKMLLNIVPQVFTNATGAGVRFLVGKAIGDRILVNPGEATYGVLIGAVIALAVFMSICTSFLAIAKLMDAMLCLQQTGREPEPRAIVPPSQLTTVTLSGFGNQSFIHAWAAHQPTVITDAQLTVNAADAVPIQANPVGRLGWPGLSSTLYRA